MIQLLYKVIIKDAIRGVRMASHRTYNEVLANTLLLETKRSNPRQEVFLEIERIEKEVENVTK